MQTIPIQIHGRRFRFPIRRSLHRATHRQFLRRLLNRLSNPLLTIGRLHELPHECAPGGDWVNVRIGGVANYWDAYDGYDALVLPRRYGGLCLPVQEGMAAITTEPS